jgi:hypothetical protein
MSLDTYDKYMKYKFKYINFKKNTENFLSNNIMSISKKIKPFTGVIKKAFPFIKVGLSGAAEVSSLGFGGDEAVELSFVVLDSLLISSDLVNLIKLNEITEFKNIINDIINLQFKGIDKLNVDYTTIMNKVSMLPPDVNQKLKLKLCSIFNELLLKLGTLFGDLLSMGLPDDSDITSLVFQHFIKNNIENNINNILNHVTSEYSKLPNEFVELIENTDKLEDTIYKTFKILLGLNTAKDMGIFAFVDPLTPLFGIILYKKHDIAKIINYTFGLFIFILKYLNDNCK